MADDWYPRKIELLPDWHENFNTQLPNLAAKYGITAGQLAAVLKDNDWIQYWVNAWNQIKQQVDQLEEFFDLTWKAALGTPEPSVPSIALPPGLPANVMPSVRERTREIARFIKGNPVYTKADGELLGIVSTPATPPNLIGLTADFKVRTLANFDLEITFVKQGTNGIRLEIRHKGGAWMFVMGLSNSPGIIHVNPQVAGEAEQIEMRGILVEKDQPVGNYSDTKTAFIAP
ncbi:hypothetical protein BH10ACI1_BH10ACI1_16200 [soil metagenome]